MPRRIACILLLAVSLPATAAEGRLDGEPSSLYRLSIQKGEVAETHHLSPAVPVQFLLYFLPQ